MTYRARLSERVHQALGAASVCWDDLGGAVFDARTATKVAEELIADIDQMYYDWHQEWLKNDELKRAHIAAEQTPPVNERDPSIHDIHDSTDAMEWAEEFCRIARERWLEKRGQLIHGDDVFHDLIEPGWLVVWFANAMAAQERKDRDHVHKELVRRATLGVEHPGCRHPEVRRTQGDDVDWQCVVCGEHFKPGGQPAMTMDVTRSVQTWANEGRHPDPVWELTEAIRHTVDYIGLQALPPAEGWSWYDALVKYAPDVAARFKAERERQDVILPVDGGPEPGDDDHPDNMGEGEVEVGRIEPVSYQKLWALQRAREELKGMKSTSPLSGAEKPLQVRDVIRVANWLLTEEGGDNDAP